MRIVALGENGVAKVESDGFERGIDISLIDNPAPGDYVIVHAGFAIERLDVEEAERQLAMLAALAESTPRETSAGPPASAG